MKSATATPVRKPPKPFKLKEFVPLEQDEQATVCDYLTRIGALYYAVANYRPLDKQFKTYNYLLAAGYKPGVPDLVICEPRMYRSPDQIAPQYRGAAYCEMKRRKGGVVSADQAQWHTALRERGYHVIVAYGATSAIEQIAAYLKSPRP